MCLCVYWDILHVYVCVLMRACVCVCVLLVQHDTSKLIQSVVIPLYYPTSLSSLPSNNKRKHSKLIST